MMVKSKTDERGPTPSFDPYSELADELRSFVKMMPSFYLRSRAIQHDVRHYSFDIQVRKVKEGSTVDIFLTDKDIVLVCDRVGLELLISDGRYKLECAVPRYSFEEDRLLKMLQFIGQLVESTPPEGWSKPRTGAIRISQPEPYNNPLVELYIERFAKLNK